MKIINNLAIAAMLGTNPASADTASISIEEFSATTHIDIMVENGIATLSGNVESWYQSVEAENIAELVEGVLLVRNRVQVAV